MADLCGCIHLDLSSAIRDELQGTDTCEGQSALDFGVLAQSKGGQAVRRSRGKSTRVSSAI